MSKQEFPNFFSKFFGLMGIITWCPYNKTNHYLIAFSPSMQQHMITLKKTKLTKIILNPQATFTWIIFFHCFNNTQINSLWKRIYHHIYNFILRLSNNIWVIFSLNVTTFPLPNTIADLNVIQYYLLSKLHQ